MPRALGALLAVLPAVLALLPLAPLAARARGRALGVHVHDLGALARGARVDTVLLDRWGTLTTGRLRVDAVEPIEADHERSLRWFAGALGHAADDPVGRALARLSGRGRLGRVERRDDGSLYGDVDRHPVRIGPPEVLGMPPRPRADRGTGADGPDGLDGVGVTVGVEVDGRPIGWVRVGDDVRDHAGDVVLALRADGIETVLVSDDTEAGTRHLARTCHVRLWHAGVPAEKRETVLAEHVAAGRVVALVASTAAPNEGTLLLSDLAEVERRPAAIRLDDLDVTRVSAALALSRTAARRHARARWTGVVLALAGGALAVAGLLVPLAAAGYALLGCGLVVGLATRR